MRVFHAQKKLHCNFTIFAMFLHHFSTKEPSRLLIISYVSLSTISDIKFGGCDLSSVQFYWGKRKIMAGMKTCALAHFLDLSNFLNNLPIYFSPLLLNFGDEFSRKVSEKIINKWVFATQRSNRSVQCTFDSGLFTLYNSGSLLAPRPVSIDQKSKGFSLEISNCKNTSNYKKTVYQISKFSHHWQFSGAGKLHFKDFKYQIRVSLLVQAPGTKPLHQQNRQSIKCQFTTMAW